MCTFKITNCPHELDIDRFLHLGGPDVTWTVKKEGISFTHSLLSVTGQRTVQPIEQGERLYMLMGEVYNYDRKFKSDVYYVASMYELYGDKFIDKLDGEYLVIVYDKRIIHIFTDTWSTRQVWYEKIGEYFYFGTYPLDEVANKRFHRDLSMRNVTATRLKHNSHYAFDPSLNELTLVDGELHKWDLNQYKIDLTDWNKAFEKAVVKRWHEKTMLSLSGGLDSSAVALCLADYGLKYSSINLCMTDAEDMLTYAQVLQYTRKYNDAYMVKEPDNAGPSIQRKRLIDAGVYHHAYSRVAKETNKRGFRVILTGHGADEIMCNYMNKPIVQPRSEFDRWPDDLTSIFPYHHFYGGYQRDIIDKHEYTSLTYALECRNVYLDNELTQEWLWLSPEIKNMGIKYPLVSYLKDRSITLPSKVAAFAGQEIRSFI